MEEHKLFVQRIGLVGMTNIIIGLSGLILMPVLTKNLTIQGWSVWSVFNITFAFIPLLANLGLPYTMVRFLAVKNKKDEIQEGFYSITFLLLFMGLISLLMIFLFSKQIALALFNGNTYVSMLLSAGVLISVLNTSFLSFFRTFQQMKLFSILSLVQTYLAVAVVTYLVLSGYGVTGAVFGYVIAQFVALLLAVVFVVHEIGFKFPEFKNMREYLSFGIPTIPVALSSWLVDLSDRFLILFLLGTVFVGYYSPAYTLGNVILMFGAPFAFLLPALLSFYYDQEKIGEVRKHLNYSFKYFMLISVPAVFGLSILSKPLLTLLTTPEITQNSYFITPFIAIGSFLFGIQGIISQILVLEKKTKILGSRWIAAAVLNICLNILLIPYYGIIVAAISTLVTYMFTFAVSWYYSLKYIKINLELDFIFKILFASILMSFVIIFINPTTIIGILGTVLMCSAVYLMIIFFLNGISKEEIEFFKKLVKG